MGQVEKKMHKMKTQMVFLVLDHHVFSARLPLTSWLTPLHTNGSLEAHNVTALVWKPTFHYEAVSDGCQKYSKAHNAMR